jgi:hypothetical protein
MTRAKAFATAPTSASALKVAIQPEIRKSADAWKRRAGSSDHRPITVAVVWA